SATPLPTAAGVRPRRAQVGPARTPWRTEGRCGGPFPITSLGKVSRMQLFSKSSRGTGAGKVRPEFEALEDRTLLSVGGGFTGGGLLGNYFNNTTLAGSPTFSRQDVRLDFSTTSQAHGGSTSPGYSALGAANWSARWTGQLIPRFGETYVFSAFAQG